MANLSTKIKLYLTANSKTWDNKKVELQDDGFGAYIKLWDYDIAQPTAEQIASYETAALQLKADYDAKQYQRDRVYPSIGDQLDMLWHSIDEDPTLKSKYFTFYEAIKSVKVKNPK
jgi:hypothetical protein